MVSIATVGPAGSYAWQAASRYQPNASIELFPDMAAVFRAFAKRQTDLALVPVYNTHEGHLREWSRLLKTIEHGFWRDNLVLSIHLSLGGISASAPISTIVGKSGVLRQCEAYVSATYPEASLVSVHDLDAAVAGIRENGLVDHLVIDSEEALRAYGLKIRAREILPHNQTRFAVLGDEPSRRTGYDATAMFTSPIKDRVGILADILQEFTRRGINLIDMQTEADSHSQKLQFLFEFEGHADDEPVRAALKNIEHQIIQEPGSVKIIGSFPRLDMRAKHIKKIGFVGSGEMSVWFAERLKNEGYEISLTGRNSALRPEAMIPLVEVVVICVPISATPDTIREYGPLLKENQALILLAGEAENVLQAALSHTKEGVEVLLVHNLWGPQATSMKDKNVSVVRTARSGVLSSEFEAFLYKHGAKISLDAPEEHDLLMGVSQKLPTSISVAMAMALKENAISPGAIGSHATLTSLYSILSMARVHAQNPRTYAEIMATRGEGRRLVASFIRNLSLLTGLAEAGDIEGLCSLIEENRAYLTERFIGERMQQALAVDATLGKVLDRSR